MNSNYVLPITIVVAGALIAGAVFLAGKSSTTPPGTTDGQTIAARAYDPAQDHILGNPSAPIKIVEYYDLECLHCKLFNTTMHQIMDNYGAGGKVAWVPRPFPLASIHPKAPQEAAAAECAAAQGGDAAYFKFVDRLFEVTPSDNGLDLLQLPVIAKDVGLNVDTFNTCLTSGQFTKKVQQGYDEALKAGGQGTPYILIMVNGQVVPGGNLSGAQPYDSMHAAIEAVLSQLPTTTQTSSSTAQ